MARRLERRRRGGDRPAVAVRGGDPRTRRSSSPARSKRAPNSSPRRSTTSRPSRSFAGAADRYVTALGAVKATVAIPVIASLNASTAGGWVRYARDIQDAGADALELNLYHVAADPRRSAADIERPDLDLIAAVRAAITIPLAVKLSPFYSAFANFAAAVDGRGRRRPRPVQSLLPARPRPRDARRRPTARAEPAVGAAAARSAGSRSSDRSSIRPSRWRRRRAPTPAPTSPRRCWSAPTSR